MSSNTKFIPNTNDLETNMTKVGYARISTSDGHQSLDLQLDALKAAGAEKIFEDAGVSGATTSRPGLDAALEWMREGDELICWRLDRVSRSVAHLLALTAELDERGIGFHSLTEHLNTTGPTGRFTMTILGAVAELERSIIRERTRAGLAAARARGRVGGRPRALTDTQLTVARAEVAAGKPVAQIAKDLGGVGVSTLYRYLSEVQTDA